MRPAAQAVALAEAPLPAAPPSGATVDRFELPGRVDSGLAGRLLLECPYRPGVTATVVGFLEGAGLGVLELEQHRVAALGDRLALRVTFAGGEDVLDLDRLKRRFASEVPNPVGIWRITSEIRRPRFAVLASREPHCLTDMLWRAESGQIGGDIALVVSNHDTHRSEVERRGVPFHHLPVTPATRREAERQLLARLRGECDLVVLAKYMQILSADFLDQLGVPIINIHHSLLPSFAGADPYRQARDRGVKLVGATAHYVTEELDGGPIIEQDVVRIDHRASREDLIRVGMEIERTVLARAVRWHLDDRVIRTGGQTVVFGGG